MWDIFIVLSANLYHNLCRYKNLIWQLVCRLSQQEPCNVHEIVFLILIVAIMVITCVRITKYFWADVTVHLITPFYILCSYLWITSTTIFHVQISLTLRACHNWNYLVILMFTLFLLKHGNISISNSVGSKN